MQPFLRESLSKLCVDPSHSTPADPAGEGGRAEGFRGPVSHEAPRLRGMHFYTHLNIVVESISVDALCP
jgi:hypothetical protein